MKTTLGLRHAQGLALTPQLQQSIRLLQLSTAELEQEIEAKLLENPALERDDGEVESVALVPDDRAALDAFDGGEAAPGEESFSEDGPIEGASAEPLEWGTELALDVSSDAADWGADAGASAKREQRSEDWGDAASDSLQDHLLAQCAGLRLSPVERAALHHLVGLLDDRGFLEDSVEEVAVSLGPADNQREGLTQAFGVARALLRSLDPPGVGASDTQDAMRLQVDRLLAQGQIDVGLAHAMLALLASPLEWLARRDWAKLQARTGLDIDAMSRALERVRQLDAHPARQFGAHTDFYVRPDVFARRRGREFVVELNPDVLPKLRLYDFPRVHTVGRGAALASHAQDARWFIKNVQQRFETILQVSQSIARHQHNFLLRGAGAMRPLILRQVADELGLHESTVSRVTNAKYIHTDFGTFELKYFFSSSLDTSAGATVSSTAVKTLIRSFIESEISDKRLSDGELADLLLEHGVKCARRTVAKYRESLHIPVAAFRN